MTVAAPHRDLAAHPDLTAHPDPVLHHDLTPHRDPVLHHDLTPHRDVIDYETFTQAEPEREPFEFLVLPGFVPRDAAIAAAAAFPGPSLPGVLPAPDIAPDDAFGELLRAMRSPRLSAAMGAKFGLLLTPETLMVTLRARTRPIDGRIHTDSETKLVTGLIYLNGDWSEPGGRLRLLRGPDDIEDMIAEVPPVAGTLIAFRRSDRSWHGHKPYMGERRAIMLNWMIDSATARRELRRHAVSAGIKRLFGTV
jgi:SM-20-related protein